jgi:hypothetical protein
MRTYFLAKIGGWMNSMPQDFINYGGSLGWISSSLSTENFPIFEEIYPSFDRFYILHEVVGSKGFRCFGEVREKIKVISTDLPLGKVYHNTAAGDLGPNEEEMNDVTFVNESLSWDPTKQELIITQPESYTPTKIEIPFDQQRHDAAVLAMKAVAKAVIEEEFDKKFAKLDLNCKIEEATFPYQYEDAVAYKANPEGEYPLLAALAESRDLTIEEIADRILGARGNHKTRLTSLISKMNEVKSKYKVLTTTSEMNLFYEEYLGIPMPFNQAVVEGRIVISADGEETRIVPYPKGFQF